jgi:hypothetical protein
MKHTKKIFSSKGLRSSTVYFSTISEMGFSIKRASVGALFFVKIPISVQKGLYSHVGYADQTITVKSRDPAHR